MPRGQQPGQTGAEDKYAKAMAVQRAAAIALIEEERKLVGQEAEVQWRATKLLEDLGLEARPSTLDRAILYFELRTAIRHTAMRTETMENNGAAKNRGLLSSLGQVTKQANDVYEKLVADADLAKKTRASAPPTPIAPVTGRSAPSPAPPVADDDGWGKPLSES